MRRKTRMTGLEERVHNQELMRKTEINNINLTRKRKGKVREERG